MKRFDIISILAFRSKKYYNILGRREGKEGGMEEGRKTEKNWYMVGKFFQNKISPKYFIGFLRSTEINQIMLYFHIPSWSLAVRE